MTAEQKKSIASNMCLAIADDIRSLPNAPVRRQAFEIIENLFEVMRILADINEGKT